MKWGIRHDPEPTGRFRSGSYSTSTRRFRSGSHNTPTGRFSSGSNSAPKRKKKRGFDKAAKILLGAAAVTGVAAVGIYVGKKRAMNGRLVADNIIKAGTTLRHVTQHPETIKNGKRIYAASRKTDAIKYRAMFGESGGLLKKSAETVVKKDIRVAGLKTGEEVFNKLYKTDSKFAKEVDDMYKKNAPFLFNAKGKWEVFNTIAPLKDPNNPNFNRPAYDTFEKALRDKGYHGFADVNDRKNSGFNTNAHILFDYKDNIGEVKVTQMSRKDILKAQRQMERHDTMSKYITAENAAYVAAGSALAGTMVEIDSRVSNSHGNSYSNRKKKTRKKYNVKAKN